MRILYHRLMARFYLKWNKKGFQKHINKILDILAVNFYYMVKHAPERVLQETKDFRSNIYLTRRMYYQVSVKVEHVQKMISELEGEQNE